MTAFAAEVEQATNGEIKIIMYPGQTLSKSAEVLDGLIKGVSDFGYSILGYNKGRLPLMSVGDLPIVVDSSEKMSEVTLATYKKFKPAEFDEIKPLGFLNMSASGLSTNVPTNKFADVAGQQIRCTGSDVDLVKALGGVPVAIPITDAYVALQKGTADGNLGDYASLMSYKLGEVCKIHIEYYFRNTVGWFGMNLNTWRSLTPEQQKIIADMGEKYTTILGKSRDETNAEGREWCEGLGNTFVKLPAEEEAKWAAALKPLYDKWVEDQTALGLPAQAVLDFVQAAVK